ncbi:aminopeptidase P family protein [Streptomyces hirsutus]|uniref:Aminopeptidase P family protein n=1 Tax=Streptomyces hirsutus TaxID=35620 RepID=A0ABZ1GE10_9ACTN|nr:M24 family metallopeptidase [Streptomyces hirsutus]WSD04349.1 aminopeptidase P family protein [Streptomyces hirsutus]WTD22263.1 aminopeptidase P family protein [Streptomyces hirsutus]
MLDESVRAARLLEARAQAVELFTEVSARGLITPGKRERTASDEVRDLAHDLFGTTRYWHKRIVRCGPNTLRPYEDNPPDRVIGADDIAFVDFGPIFDQWEADFGRTYVLGDDVTRLRLRDALPGLFAEGKRFFDSRPELTAAHLYAEIERLARDSGWELGGWHAGHLVGEFPHERIKDELVHSYITPGNDLPLRRRDRSGRVCHWILEIHLIDRRGGFGGFYEDLLDL